MTISPAESHAKARIIGLRVVAKLQGHSKDKDAPRGNWISPGQEAFEPNETTEIELTPATFDSTVGSVPGSPSSLQLNNSGFLSHSLSAFLQTAELGYFSQNVPWSAVSLSVVVTEAPPPAGVVDFSVVRVTEEPPPLELIVSVVLVVVVSVPAGVVVVVVAALLVVLVTGVEAGTEPEGRQVVVPDEPVI
mgnify:CR=1 FL=1